MNGDGNGTVHEPMESAVQYGQNSILEPHSVTAEILTNGISEHTNSSENHVDNYRDPKNVKTYNNCDDAQDNYRDKKNIKKDDIEVSQDKVSNGDTSLDLHNNNSCEGSLGGTDSHRIVTSTSNNCLKDRQLQSDTGNYCENFVKDSEDMEIEDSDEILQVTEQGTKINTLELNHNSVDGSSEQVDDIVGDTMSSGEIEEERLQNDINGDLKVESFKIVTIKRHHSDDENSSDYSDSEEEPKIEDTVSIHSNSDDLAPREDSLDNSETSKTNEVIILENDETESPNGSSKTAEIHEIGSDVSDNDDCVVTAIENVAKKTESKKKKNIVANNTNVELRRSSRTIKRKKYDDDIQHLDDGSDIEEVILDDPLKNKSNNKATMETVSKKLKLKNNQKKETTIFIMDSASKSHTPPVNISTSHALNKNIYQRIAAQGTSVTPVTTKTMTTQATQVNLTANAPPILPTLTDEMFVVEAPSFIVPYVYEKPATVPFKEFVDKLGKEIEEEKAKEEQVLLEKKKAERAKREQEKQEKRERGEEAKGSDEEINSEEISRKKAEKAEKKERRRRRREDDDVSWDGSSSDESEDDSISDDDGQAAIKDKANIIDEIKDVITDPVASSTTKSESYFDLRLGKFFMDIGLNLVQEYVQTDLLNQQNRKLQREKKSGQNTKNRQVSIALLTENLKLSQKNNELFTFEQKKCKFCTFKTESALAMAHHLETPHMKNNLYTCNYCSFTIRSPHDILFHMEKEHGVKAKLERTPAPHQCTNCPFEDHGKGKLARHLIACAKKFKPETNLAPPIEWEHPAKIAKLSRGRSSGPYVASQFGRHHVDGACVSNVRIPIANANVLGSIYRGRAAAAPRAPPAPPAHLRPTAGLLIRHTPPAQMYPTANTKKQTNHSISITPLPRQSVPMQPLHATNTKGFVMCEICDGYIKDLEQLRNHMQWIHKVKIHPKMIYNRPPLNCQKCQFRFFTDQGLERHLLGSHGLVTSAIQEAANRGKDAGRCPVCGRVYQWKLLGHVSRDHNLTLKPAHLSYKCTVCTATFGMYRHFESHVYSAHSVVAKKVMDKKAGVASPKVNANENAAKQLKINNEITITPQPVKGK